MDVFDIHNVKVEKANAMLRYRQFRKIAKLFRLLELFLAVALLSWISSRLPFVIGVFREYFRQLISVIVCPLFIFLIGNVIVLTLVIKSSQFTGNPSSVSESGANLYEEIVNNVTEDVPEQIVYQDKQIVSEVNIKPNCNENEIKMKSISDLDLKVYRRSQSDNLMKRECVLGPDEVSGKLKRSETEINRQKSDTPVAERELNDVVDDLSNEEFKRKIEGFIARQVRFHKEEKLAIVVPTTTVHNLM